MRKEIGEPVPRQQLVFRATHFRDLRRCVPHEELCYLEPTVG